MSGLSIMASFCLSARTYPGPDPPEGLAARNIGAAALAATETCRLALVCSHTSTPATGVRKTLSSAGLLCGRQFQGRAAALPVSATAGPQARSAERLKVGAAGLALIQGSEAACSRSPRACAPSSLVARIGPPCGPFWADSRVEVRCRSSVVEHSIGNGEVDSSILSGSTIHLLENIDFVARTSPNCITGLYHSTSMRSRQMHVYKRPNSDKF